MSSEVRFCELQISIIEFPSISRVNTYIHRPPSHPISLFEIILSTTRASINYRRQTTTARLENWSSAAAAAVAFILDTVVIMSRETTRCAA